MKKTLLAAPLLAMPNASRLRLHRQVGFQSGKLGASRQHVDYRLYSQIAKPAFIQLASRPFKNQSACYNNVTGTGVRYALADASFAGSDTYLSLYNNQCNYSVEGGILASIEETATATATAGAIGMRLMARAATTDSDGEQLGNFSVSTLSSNGLWPGAPILATRALCCPTRLSGSSRLAALPRLVCKAFWIFPS